MNSTQKQEALKAIEQFITQKEKAAKSSTGIDELKGKWTLTQLHILALISDYPTEANNTFLSRNLHITKPAVTKAVKLLLEKEMIVRKYKEGDRKSIYYCLTDEGKKLALLHKELHMKAEQRYYDLFEEFNKEELTVITKFLKRWTETISEENRK
ncbi:MarR family transcriptional regulator [Priestia filamentosa]|uniref:MarR family transcriptional regulator n=1 Tax=Priestia filamentosa TaxID=1402861 RepID=UPI001FB26234|nr:MarR family transcriptional regulator [Priestia filamentosa]MED3726435.1 MarR family transcriptional regulator [Priestia filamentosa]UOE60418.1 MarR family transcriptional regulator [Priestia filamentosa]